MRIISFLLRVLIFFITLCASGMHAWHFVLFIISNSNNSYPPLIPRTLIIPNGPFSTKVLRLHSTGYLFTINNPACAPANPEVGRKNIIYIKYNES